MRRLLVAAVAAALLAPAALARPTAPPEPETVAAVPVQALATGNGLRLTVHVFDARDGRGKPGSTGSICDDGAQSLAPATFAKVKQGGMTFNIAEDTIPSGLTGAAGAIGDSFATWDATEAGALADAYFTVNGSGGATRPSQDGNNTVGWAKLVPKNTLAAAWTWTDADGRVTEADVFFNSSHSWGVFAACNAESRYVVGMV